MVLSIISAVIVWFAMIFAAAGLGEDANGQWRYVNTGFYDLYHVVRCYREESMYL